MKKVLVGLSGGVDSAVSAILMLEKGYEVIGLTLNLTDLNQDKIINDAKKIAKKLNIEHHVLDLKKEFSLKVKEYFINEYLKGYTPNPCAMCNFYIKFGFMLEYALKLGCSHVVTGHYADLIYDCDINKWIIKKSDSLKDQSYFLYKLNQYQLSHIIFPLKNIEKSKVREIAKKHDLFVWDKKESQDICFIKNETHFDFIKKHINLAPEPGNFISETGEILGQHKGIINYTVGQRKCLGISLGKKVFVKSINPNENSITIVEHNKGKCDYITAKDYNFIFFDNNKLPSPSMDFLAKLRHKGKEIKCIVHQHKDYLKIIFKEPTYFPAPGQAIVFYNENGILIGGATIIKD